MTHKKKAHYLSKLYIKEKQEYYGALDVKLLTIFPMNAPS